MNDDCDGENERAEEIIAALAGVRERQRAAVRADNWAHRLGGYPPSAALIVRFKEPYIQWAAGLDPGDTDIADDLRQHTSVYLVPEDPLDVQETAPLADFFGAVFDLELEAWCIDDSLWPPVRDLDTFLEWFEVVGESVVIDLGREPLRSEEM